MVQQRFDAIVLGLGAMGAAALYQLSLTGKRVLGIDRFSPPHSMGSSHGDSRITRQAIGEGAHYVPLALRSHEIWRDLERRTGKGLLFPVGGLLIGGVTGSPMHHRDDFVGDTIAAARSYGIEHELLDAAQIRRRFPQFAVSDRDTAYFEPGAGYVRPEECIRVQLDFAKQQGARIHLNEQVLEIESGASGVQVRSKHGTYEADQLVLSAGAWVTDFLGREKDYFQIVRQVLYWFAPLGPITPFEPERCPIFIWSFAEGGGVYGFPGIDGANGGVKVAWSEYDQPTTADQMAREVSPAEIAAMYEQSVRGRLPLLSSRCIKAVACLYTVTHDAGFVIQRDPERDRVIIVSPCSGHGFKHSAAIGEAVAQLVTSGTSTIDLSGMRFKA